MRTEYDRKERERFNRGWHYVLDLAGRISLDAGPMLKDALRIERKGRGSLILAKGLLLECLAENPTTQSVADLYGKSRGCQLAYILAAYWNGRREWEEIRSIIAEGAAAQRGVSRRG